MPRRRKQPARDFTRCQRCGHSPVFWAPKDSRETDKPLDLTRPLYVDMDAGGLNVQGYDRHGYAIRGAVVDDLVPYEQRLADEDRGALSGEGVRRIVKVWPLHACEPARTDSTPSRQAAKHNGSVVGATDNREPGTENRSAALCDGQVPLGGQDRAAGEAP